MNTASIITTIINQHCLRQLNMI